MKNPLLDAALAYAARGWHIVPLYTIQKGKCTCHAGAACESPGKHPRTRHGVKDASTDEKKIRNWWRTWPNSNVGIATGSSSGLLVVDEDPKHGGTISLEELEARRGKFPDTVVSHTGGGGRHFLFEHPGGKITSTVGVMSGVDIRADGTLIVVEPSLHISGKRYTWEVGSGPSEIPLALAPASILELLKQAAPTNGAAAPVGDEIPDGRRNDTLTSLAGTMRRRNMSEAAILAALLEENARCRPPLDEKEIRRIVESVLRYPPALQDVEPIHRTDLGNARRLRAKHGPELRYCHPWRKWLAWDGRRWEEDATARVLRLAREIVSDMFHEAAGLQGDEREALVKWALASESERRLEAMAGLCESETGIPVLPADLDKGAWLLNTPSGTVDLRTGELRTHKEEDLLTKLAGAPFDPSATCPRFERFLVEIMAGRAHLAAFLRRAFGYAATGDCRERRMVILHGVGRNGKSTLMNIMAEAFGDYSAKIPTSTFLAKRGDAIPNDIAMLKGIRLAFAAETGEGRRLDEALIKEMTGRERMTARFLHAEFFSFLPEFVPFLGTNHRPVIDGTDDGIWDRICLVPFGVRFDQDREDKNLIGVLRSELPGIVGWIVRGALEWQRDGLGEPEEVVEATTGYRGESDRLAEFIVDKCITGPSFRTPTAALFKAYKGWAESRWEEPLGAVQFGGRLREKGFLPQKGTAGRRMWLGIGLLGEESGEVAQSGGLSGVISRDFPSREKTPETAPPLATTPLGRDPGEEG